MGLNLTIPRDPGSLIADGPHTPQKTAIVRDHLTDTGQVILVAGLSLLLIFTVLAFGGLDQWAIAILEIGSALLLLFWIWPQISSGHLQLRATRMYAPVVLFSLIIVAHGIF